MEKDFFMKFYVYRKNYDMVVLGYILWVAKGFSRCNLLNFLLYLCICWHKETNIKKTNSVSLSHTHKHTYTHNKFLSSVISNEKWTKMIIKWKFEISVSIYYIMKFTPWKLTRYAPRNLHHKIYTTNDTSRNDHH